MYVSFAVPAPHACIATPDLNACGLCPRICSCKCNCMCGPSTHTCCPVCHSDLHTLVSPQVTQPPTPLLPHTPLNIPTLSVRPCWWTRAGHAPGPATASTSVLLPGLWLAL
eukprot:353145-Chlamydomonas_euryale.AAC.2